MMEEIIKEITTKERLADELKKNIESKYIEGEHWFKNPDKWMEMTSFSNPYFTIYSEFKLIMKSQDKIDQLISDCALIFYGVGTGDTELLIVESLLKKKNRVEVIGIDIQKRFIEIFIQSLKNLKIDEPLYDIDFKGINGLFQELNKKDLKTKNYKQAHILLGNTFGNFNEQKILSILSLLMKKRDILIIGFQTKNDVKNLLKKYSQNDMFNQFIKESIPNCNELAWKFNESDSQIEAWDKDILVFHSKKKNPREMITEIESAGFKNIYSINDKNSAIQIFEVNK